MSKYQSKYHQHICSIFRYLSFTSVVITLCATLAFMWAKVPDEAIVMKLITSSFVIIIASAVVKVIFSEPKASKEE